MFTRNSCVSSHRTVQRASVLFWPLVSLAVAGLLLLNSTDQASGQDEGEVYEEEVVEILTDDGVKLKASYYAGADYDSTPVVIVHGFGEDRSKYQELGERLQALGHTVLLPDLRGHGESTETTGIDKKERPITIDTKGMNRDDILNMIFKDMEAVKDFLVERNDLEELNIRKMCIIGAEMGAVIALNYTAVDWQYEDRGLLQQGKDVKGIVLLSPPTVYKGVPVKKALASIAQNDKISVMTLVGGKEKKAAAVAGQIHKILSMAKVRKLPSDPAEAKKKKTLFFKEFDTNLQGQQLLGNGELGTEKYIAGFISRRIAKQDGKDFVWKKRGR